MTIFPSVCRFRGECVVSDRQGHHQRHREAHLCWDTLLDGPRGHGAGQSEYKIRIILMYHLLNYNYETSKISPPPQKKAHFGMLHIQLIREECKEVYCY